VRTIAAAAFTVIGLHILVAGADAQSLSGPESVDRFNVNPGGPILAVPQADNTDPVRCFDHVMRDAINATQAYQIVYAAGWKQEIECHGRAPHLADLDPCWTLLLQARPLIEQAAQSFESARRSREPTSGELVHKGNALIKQAADLLAQARRCFQPTFAKWQQNGGRYPGGEVAPPAPPSPPLPPPSAPTANSPAASMADVFNAATQAAAKIKGGDTGPNVLQPVQQAQRNLPAQVQRPIECYDILVDAVSKRRIQPDYAIGRADQAVACYAGAADPQHKATSAPSSTDPFLAGVQDGTKVCAQSLENLVGAVLAFVQGDFVRSQQLLGIEHNDVATQFLTAIANDLTTPVATEPLTPYANGYRISRRICTYATLWRPRGAKSPVPNLPARSWARGLESGGADVWSGQYHVDPFTGQRFPIMGRSRVPSSHATSTFSNKGESLAYHEARFTQNEIGLQAPAGANVPGTDFITAARSRTTGLMEIIVTDVKTSMKGNFPAPKTTIKGSWRTEVLDAVGRLQLGDAGLEAEIVDAVMNNRIRLRQLNVDLQATTQDITRQSVNISGW